ncbi:alpha/beta hydrolase family protein [Cohnella thailandensis]|uniref:Alpha/beta hydrolase n=1 Tax=Cohnella thailandensis TaxID=557557 RepID=A0A841SXQ8_9BACL|nr:alpha/beta hydrolase [Cohnella thailandensis]MBB6634397.1 alpha/beta hydrolase [Cohnella thailandensis]MBP1972103.1 dienelactone hydrolase [Cohnella thailandensis]
MNIEMERVRTTRLREKRGFLGLRFEEGLWRSAAGGIWVASTSTVALSALGAPTGFGTGFDLAAAIVLNVLALALSGIVVAWLLSGVRREVPALAIGAALYTIAALSVIFVFAEIQTGFAIGLAALLTGIGGGGGWVAGVLARRGPWRTKLAAVLSALLAAGFIGLLTVDSRLFGAEENQGVALADAGEAIEALAEADPSQAGDYAYRAFTYGSGEDKHRPEFGESVGLISEPADASGYTSDWPWPRKRFWGFDESELPLNGRVWMPEGDGPWPLVLMVHGNHLMEDYSDEGYGYLGELLASRGFLAISVDENYLNYSVWRGIPDEDMKLRAWILLKHIGQLERFANDPSTPFYEAVDFDRVALLGHSRGGQAVAMAADREAWFAADNALPDRESYRIRAVIAIAPTDTTVDGKTANLKDVAYMTLQGSEDADVNNFYGERQYQRTSFAPGSDAFKTSLYIAGANHGQFNTTWGARDESMPAGLFLKKPDLSGEQQRKIAKVYVSAFLEDALHGNAGYRPLFRDYRAGAGFLPDTSYWSQYEDAGFVPVARYENAGSSEERPEAGITASAAGADAWEREEALDRQKHGKGNSGVVLSWSEEGASYALQADSSFRMSVTNAEDGSLPMLSFSMANLSWLLKENQGAEAAAKDLNIRVEAEDAAGRTANVSLSGIFPIQATPRTSFTWLGWPEAGLGRGQYAQEAESVFQTYLLPLERFGAAGHDVDWNHLRRIVFYFGGAAGQVMLDDIGFAR